MLRIWSRKNLAHAPASVAVLRGTYPARIEFTLRARLTGPKTLPGDERAVPFVRMSDTEIVAAVPTERTSGRSTLQLRLVAEDGRTLSEVAVPLIDAAEPPSLVDVAKGLLGWPGDSALTRAHAARGRHAPACAESVQQARRQAKAVAALLQEQYAGMVAAGALSEGQRANALRDLEHLLRDVNNYAAQMEQMMHSRR
jgi:hypothetical protein